MTRRAAVWALGRAFWRARMMPVAAGQTATAMALLTWGCHAGRCVVRMAWDLGAACAAVAAV